MLRGACAVLLFAACAGEDPPAAPIPRAAQRPELDDARFCEPGWRRISSAEVWDRARPRPAPIEAGEEALAPYLEAPYIVRGRVIERGAGRVLGGAYCSEHTYYVIEILEALRGDTGEIRGSYGRRFIIGFDGPVWARDGSHGDPIPPRGRGALPASSEYLDRVGAEYLFFVELPTRSASASGRLDIPPEVEAEHGSYDVELWGVAPAERAALVRRLLGR